MPLPRCLIPFSFHLYKDVAPLGCCDSQSRAPLIARLRGFHFQFRIAAFALSATMRCSRNDNQKIAFE